MDIQREFTTRTFRVLGYCRSTVGGYDIWEYNGLESTMCSWFIKQRNVADTSINVMNYMAVIKCLEHINDMTEYMHEYINLDARPRIEIICGCFMVCQQLNGTMQSSALKQLHQQCNRLINHISLRINVTFVYDSNLIPPKYV